MAKNKGEFTFDDINKELSQINPLGSVMEHSEFSEVTEWIDTGNYALNAALSGSLFGGWPNNRSSAICGPSGTGKTYLALNSVRAAQQMGYNIIFYDSEAAVDRPLMKKFGIDTERVNYQPVNTVQDFRTSITTLTNRMQDAKQKGEKLPKMMVVLDSAGNLATQKEIDDAISGSEKSDMTRAKLLKSTFRIIQTPLAHLKIPFIFTNHTYQTQDFISQQVAGGGTGPEYAASIQLFLNKAQLKDSQKNKTGIVVTAKPAKNRFARPNPIKFHLHYTEGMNRYIGLEKYIDWENVGVCRGRVEKDGTKVPDPSAKKWICKHLDKPVDNKYLFTSTVFTQEVKDNIEEYYIKDIFRYHDESEFDVEEVINDDENAEENGEDEDDEQ